MEVTGAKEFPYLDLFQIFSFLGNVSPSPLMKKEYVEISSKTTDADKNSKKKFKKFFEWKIMSKMSILYCLLILSFFFSFFRIIDRVAEGKETTTR